MCYYQNLSSIVFWFQILLDDPSYKPFQISCSLEELLISFSLPCRNLKQKVLLHGKASLGHLI
jgi:hypothetical protein